jgi:transposase
MYNIETVLKAIDYKNNTNKSNRQIAKLINVSRTTVNRWLKNYRFSLESLQSRIYRNKVYEQIKEIKKLKLEKNISNLEIINFLIELLKQKPFLRKKEIVILLTNQFNIKFNINKVNLLILKLNYTYKKPRQYIVKNIAFIDKLIEERKIFTENIKKEIIDKIISIDESGFQKLEKHDKGLSKKGVAISIPKEIKYNNISAIVAINTKKILHYCVTDKHVNGIIFNDFIKGLITKLNGEKGFIFLMDNVPFHYNKDLIKNINDSGNTIMYTPKYSPNHNPIENFFGILKKIYYDIPKNVEINNIPITHNYYTNDYDYNNYSEKKKRRKRKINKIKYYITVAINEINNTYLNFSEKMFNRAFNYNYKDITTEIRDRIIFNNQK